MDFKKLKLYEGVNIELGTQQLQKLLEEVDKRKAIVGEGVKFGHREYVLNDKENILVIDDDNVRNILNQLLKKGYSEDFWNLLNSKNPDLADKLSAGHLQLHRVEVVENLRVRLTHKYHETQGEDSWQNWIYKHSWLFGANYQRPIEKQKINLTGVMPDYLFPTVDGFIDILEIKLPTFEVIEADISHSGSWVWSKESNKAIGQVVNYLNEIDRLKLEIERLISSSYHIEISILKPRAYILIGQNNDWGKEKKEGLRKLNYYLHGIEVITYSDLVKRGEAFIKLSTVDNP